MRVAPRLAMAFAATVSSKEMKKIDTPLDSYRLFRVELFSAVKFGLLDSSPFISSETICLEWHITSQSIVPSNVYYFMYFIFSGRDLFCVSVKE